MKILKVDRWVLSLNESSLERLIWTNLGLRLTVFNISKTDIWGKWSDRLLDLTTQDNKCCFVTLSLQNIWSISEALNLLDLVGTVILGNMPWVTNISKYLWNSDRSFILSKSMLKSPVIIMLALPCVTSEIIEEISWQNSLIVLLLLFEWGGLYIFPIITFSRRDFPLTSINIPSHRWELLWKICKMIHNKRGFAKGWTDQRTDKKRKGTTSTTPKTTLNWGDKMYVGMRFISLRQH